MDKVFFPRKSFATSLLGGALNLTKDKVLLNFLIVMWIPYLASWRKGLGWFRKIFLGKSACWSKSMLAQQGDGCPWKTWKLQISMSCLTPGRLKAIIMKNENPSRSFYFNLLASCPSTTFGMFLKNWSQKSETLKKSELFQKKGITCRVPSELQKGPELRF